MKDLISYIPFYVRRADAYEQLEQTITSLKAFSTKLVSIRVLYCQPEQENGIAKMARISDEIGSRFEPHLLRVREPILLPTAAYHFMQMDGMAEDPCFYIEADHVLFARPGFLESVFREINSGNVIMPHRLGKRPIHKGRLYAKWQDYYVGNYAEPDIHTYSPQFNSVTGYYSAYAGAYFSQRSIIQENRLSFPWTTNILWRGLVEYIRRLSGGKLFGSQAPHGLLLEAPSLVFQANHQRVLKPCDIEHLHVIHLSQNGVV